MMGNYVSCATVSTLARLLAASLTLCSEIAAASTSAVPDPSSFACKIPFAASPFDMVCAAGCIALIAEDDLLMFEGMLIILNLP